MGIWNSVSNYSVDFSSYVENTGIKVICCYKNTIRDLVNNILLLGLRLLDSYICYKKQDSGVALLQKVVRLIKHVNHELD